MRNEITIVPYTVEQNEEALIVESLCPQGDGMKLRFVRPTFHKRTEVYERAMIYSAVYQGKVIGVAAGAEKSVSLHGETVRTTYGYDLRVHPEFRKYGTAKKLTDMFDEYFGPSIQCNYTYVAGANTRALAHIRLGIGSRVMIPMNYFIIPVYRTINTGPVFADCSMEELHSLFLKNTPDTDFVPALPREKMIGYVGSISEGSHTGSSIWTNEEVLAEQVLHLPAGYSILRYAEKIFSPVIRLPKIPEIGETIKSWFLFDLFARDEQALRQLISSVSVRARANGKDFLYILLTNHDPLVSILKKTRMTYFTLPYVFMAKGSHIPNQSDRLYVDIRDL